MALEANSHKRKGRIKGIIKFIVRTLLFYPHIKKMNENFASNERQMLFKKQPDFLTKCITPYLRDGLSKKEIVNILIQHYQWFEYKSFFVSSVLLHSDTVGVDCYFEYV